MAERVGFEPTVPFEHNGFRDRPIQPLSHLSARPSVAETASDSTSRRARSWTLRRARSNYRLPGAILYATVEPCLMCVGAIVQARVATVVYGVADPKAGAVRSLLDPNTLPLNHRFEVVEGVLAGECRQLLQDFFRDRR